MDNPKGHQLAEAMNASGTLARLGALTGEPARASMLSLLLDGRAHTAKELGIVAGISPQTASWHLAKLIDGRLLISEKVGRQRYFSLASPLVGQMLETMLAVVSTGQPQPGRPSAAKRPIPPRSE